MFQTRTLIDRISTPTEILIETPIFHALRSAETPIFHALVTGEPTGRGETPRVEARVARIGGAPQVDDTTRFRRDPLTAPIPIQAFVDTWMPPHPKPRPIRPVPQPRSTVDAAETTGLWRRPEHPHRPGRHRLLAPASA